MRFSKNQKKNQEIIILQEHKEPTLCFERNWKGTLTFLHKFSYCIRSLSMLLALSACSDASLFHASHAILAWFHDSSHEASLLRNDITSSESRWTSMLEAPPPPPLPKARGEVREGDWNLGDDIMSKRLIGLFCCDDEWDECDLGLRTKLARDPDCTRRRLIERWKKIINAKCHLRY